jgi:ABC-type nitrate/sulfonate/bicarbonate transport system permease component
MGWMPRLRIIVDPFIAAFHPIPKTAIYPLVMIIFGIGEPSKVVTIAVATFFPALINSMAGVRQIPPVYLEVAKNYGARHWKTFTRVILPGSLPMLLAGIRIAFNNALVITIAVELLVARKGLGVMIWFAWETLRTADLYATLVIIAVIGILANILLQRLSLLVAPWYRFHPLDEEKTS